MKKFLAMLAVCACAAAAFAALDTGDLTATVSFPAQSVSAGATVTNAVQAVSGCKGIGEINVAVGSVAAASGNRTVSVTLIGTNTVAGGWVALNSASYKGAGAAVIRVPFQGDYLPPFIKVAVGNTTASSVVSGVLLTYK